MRKFSILFALIFLGLTQNVFATVNVVKFPSGTPVAVCTPSDSNSNCQGAGGGSGNVGIGTAGWNAYYGASGTTVIASSTIFTSGSNVGINSLAPGAALDIGGTGRATAFQVNGSGYGAIASANGLQFDASNPTVVSPGLVLTTGGNMGVGTTTANARVDVIGTLKSTGFQLNLAPLANGNVLVSNSVGVGTWMPPATIGASGGGTSSQWITYGQAGNVGIGTKDTVGIGTTLGSAGLAVMNGNIGMGSWNPEYGLVVTAGGAKITGTGFSNFTSNVGINSAAPGTSLDVQGSIRASTSIGIGTYNVCTTQGTCPGITGGQNNPGGIFPQLQYASSPTVFNGITLGGTDGTNIGVGTVSFVNRLNVSGNMGIGASSTTAYVTQSAVNAGLVVEGNIGVGTWKPLTALDVRGTMESTGLQLNLAPLANGNRLVSNSVGVGTWMLPGIFSIEKSGSAALSGDVTLSQGANITLTQSGNDISIAGSASGGSSQWFTQSGIGIGTFESVGIGTSTFGNKLSIFGNVGIGTNAASLFITNAPDASGVTVEGNVGIGTTKNSTSALTVMNGNVGIGTWKPVNIFQVGTFNQYAAGTGNGFIVDSSYNAYTSASMGAIGSVTCGGLAVGSCGINTNGVNVSNSGGTGTFGNSGGAAGSNTLLRGGTGSGNFTEIRSASANSSGGYVKITGGNSGATEIARFTDTGNVGLGTITPVATLGIVGNIGIGTVKDGDLFLSTAPPNGGMLIEKNVGIGTLAPGAPLDITGAMRQSTNPTNCSAGNHAMGVDGSLNAECASDSAGSSQFITGSIGIGTYGNLGVGTVNPQARLIVLDGNVGIGTITADGGKLIVIGGNVGVGVVSPNDLLHVAKNQDGTTELKISNSTDGTSAAASIDIPASGSEAYVSAKATSYNGISGWAARSIFGSTVGATLNAAGGDIRFEVGGNGTSNVKAIIDTAGNVGIGTLGPRSALEIVGRLKQSVTPTACAAGNYPLGIDGDLNVVSCTSATPGSSQWKTDSIGVNTVSPVGIGTSTYGGFLTVVGNVGIATTGSSNYALLNAPIGGLIVEGNTGIGTNAPQMLLQIKGGNVGIGTNLNQHARLEVTSDGTANIDVVRFNPTGQNSTGPFVMDSNGNVGINTVSPQTSLSVNGTIRIGTTSTNQLQSNGNWQTGGTFTTSDASRSSINLSSATGGLAGSSGTAGGGIMVTGSAAATGHLFLRSTSATGTSDVIQFQVGNAGGTTAATISTSGNVGLGTVTPLSVLGILGNVGIGTISYSAYLLNTPPAGSIIVEKNIGIGTFNPNNSLIVASGNVGIGTLAPGTALDVNGGVRLKTSLVGIGTLSIGASVQVAANQACNTTCTNGACFMGEDTSVLGSFVDCADATADRCICIDGLTGL